MTEVWRDPTHGRIDRDIQEVVSHMNPTSLGQQVALENTMQEIRNRQNPKLFYVRRTVIHVYVYGPVAAANPHDAIEKYRAGISPKVSDKFETSEEGLPAGDPSLLDDMPPF